MVPGPSRAARCPASLFLAASLLAGGCVGSAPRYGSITFEDPAPAKGDIARRNVAPVRIAYVSRREPEEQSVPGVQTRTGTLGWELRKDDIDQDYRRRKLQGPLFRGDKPVVLGPEDFQGLWLELEKAGLFTLPRHPGPEPPEERPYFLVEGPSGRRVFVRPEIPRRELTDAERDELQAALRSWSESKLVVSDYRRFVR